MAERAAPLLEARGLAAGYGRKAVVEDATLALGRGELVCVLGRNGSGKSTLLRTLAGMQAPLRGSVELAGAPLASYRPRQLARRVGVVLPERAHPGLLSVAELVALGRHPYTDWLGRLGPADEAAIAGALEAVGIAELATRRVATLSDGERQKAMIARALAQEPEILILDEPTAFLDLPGRVETMALLARLAHGDGGDGDGDGHAVALSTHDLELALRHADRVWLLDGRGGVERGRPRELALAGAFERAFASAAVSAAELSRYLDGGIPPPRASG